MVWNISYFSIILWNNPSQLTFIFFRGVGQPPTSQWIGLRENPLRKPWFLPSNWSGFPVKIFPSSNSMNQITVEMCWLRISSDLFESQIRRSSMATEVLCLSRSLTSTLKPQSHSAWTHKMVIYGFVWKCWVYSQWNSHLIGIMISKTIGFRGTQHFQTHPYGDTPAPSIPKSHVWRTDDLGPRGIPSWWVPGTWC